MPLPDVFRKKGIFGVYWMLILLLAGYLVYDRYTDQFEAMTPVLEQTVSQGTAAARNTNEWNLTDIHKWTDAYKLNDNEVLRRQAKAAMQLADSCQQTFRTLVDKNGRIDGAELNHLAASLRQFADSLLLYAEHDSLIAADLTTLLYQPATGFQTAGLAGFFKNALPAQTKLYLNDQIWKTELALRLVLDDISARVYHDDIWFDEYLPVLIVENCPELGKPFSGKIYLQGYSKQAENIRYFLDGQEVPKTEGLVRYQERFPKPGVYTRELKATITNPLTKAVRVYSKEFQIAVQQP